MVRDTILQTDLQTSTQSENRRGVRACVGVDNNAFKWASPGWLGWADHQVPNQTFQRVHEDSHDSYHIHISLHPSFEGTDACALQEAIEDAGML
jgi:hypothetical protein